MRARELVKWWWLFAEVVVAIPGVRRRQAQSTTDSCTCPANGPVTTTVVQYTTVTSSLTVSTDGGTVFSTGTVSTDITTITSGSTITVTSETTTSTDPGTAQVSTTQSTSTSTITVTATVSTCSGTAVPKARRQNTDSSSASATDSLTATPSGTDAPSSIAFTTTNGSTVGRCVCILVPPSTALQATSSCSCPATTATVVTVPSVSTEITTVTVVSASPPTTIIITPTELSTFTLAGTATSTVLVTVEATPDPSTVTTLSATTIYTTVTSTLTVNGCPTGSASADALKVSSSSSSTVIKSSSSTTSSAIGPTSSAADSFACNTTAYFVQTTNSVVMFYNIDLKSGTTIIVNRNLGGGTYTNVNGMGFNPLDNFLYGIGTLATNTYAVIRISVSGKVDEILKFTSSTNPSTVGDVDINGQFWFSGGGTSWYQVDLAPGSSTYGKMIGSGTMTLTGYYVYDWSFLPGQGEYLWALATSTDSTSHLGLLRWSMSAHTWSTYQAYTSVLTPNNILASWGNDNGTIYGFAATSGKITQLTVGGSPIALSTGPTGITNGDGARCDLAR